MWKVGEIVEIIDDLNGHMFYIGQRVRIRALHENGDVASAESLDDSEDYWFLNQDDIKKIEE